MEKLVPESLNEISHTLFKSAMGKTKEYDQYNRGYALGQKFFRDFIGKSDDFYDSLPEKISRSDARILSLIAARINPDTRYKSLNQNFRMREY